jgi:hypothetical protein
VSGQAGDAVAFAYAKTQKALRQAIDVCIKFSKRPGADL